MKRSTKKGFTIVELVIVIAIIAILAAVLIPTFASLIQKANVSKDTQLVKNLNTALAANGKEHKTMTEALAAAAEFGYDVGKINASATGNEILWDSENDVFCYLKDDKVEYIPESNATKPADYKLWKVYNAGEKVPEQQKYSIYWNRTDDFTATLTVGFDAGKCTAITALKYERTGEAQTVVIRTSSGETSLTVNAAKDTVMHYGAAGEVNVLAVDKTHSYHEFGSVHTLTAKSGHIVLESGSLVYDLKKETGADATFVSNGTVVKKAEGIDGVTVSETYDIYNLEQLCAFRDHVNAGMTFGDLPIEIKADIDMSSVSWMPIGTAEHPFYGEIRGNGHTLTGLTNGTIDSTKDAFTTGTTKTYGAAYGFIGIAGAKEANKTLRVSNLNFADVNISLGNYGNCVGTLLGYAPSTDDFTSEKKFKVQDSKGLSDVVIENVQVLGGKIEALQDAGGICGKLYNENNATIKNCENSATITSLLAADKTCRAGGIVSYASLSGTNSKLVVENCTNNGKITSNYCLAGVVSFGFSEKKVMAIEVTGCNNKGDLVWNGENTKNYWVAYIASCSSTQFESAKVGCSYNFGNETTKNINSGKVITPNVTSGAPDTIYVGLRQGAVGSTNDANGTSKTKSAAN